jgi:hypothetical protein
MSAGVNGTTCTAEEFALSLSGPGNPFPNIYCLTRGDSIGLSVRIGYSTPSALLNYTQFSVQAGTISILAVTVLFFLIAVRPQCLFQSQDLMYYSGSVMFGDTSSIPGREVGGC